MGEAFSGFWKQTSGALVIALVLRIFFVFYCPHIDDGDSPIYEDFARNLLKFGIYSHYPVPDHAPLEPTLIRVPGYPLMLAAVFAVAGDQNETAVRVSQAFLDTFTCLLIALIAFEISSGENRRRRSIAQWALFLSALCPFIANYTATILTEVPTTLLWAAATLFGLRGSCRLSVAAQPVAGAVFPGAHLVQRWLSKNRSTRSGKNAHLRIVVWSSGCFWPSVAVTKAGHSRQCRDLSCPARAWSERRVCQHRLP